MKLEERKALLSAGIVIGIIKYNDTTACCLLPKLLFTTQWRSWPNLKTFDEIFHATASNTTALTFFGKDTGLRLHRVYDNDSVSISTSHPMYQHWLSFLQPVWNKQNEGKCPTCHGTGWDGIGYTLTCVDCHGIGKPLLT